MAALIIALIVAATTALALKSPRTALLAALFLGGWGGLDVDLGLRLTAYQLVMAPLCLVMVLRLLYPGTRPQALYLGWPFAIMLLYAVINSAFQIANLPQAEIANSFLRGPVARASIQIPLYLFTLAPVVLVPFLFNQPGDALKLLRVWFASTLTLAIVGFLQLAIWYGTGFNPLPLGFSNTLLGGTAPVLREGIVVLDGTGIYRMNSFAPEPRYLGTTVSLAMVILQGLALALPEAPGKRLFGLWLFLLVALLLTYSSGAIAVWFIGTAALLPALWVCRVPIQRSTRSIIAAASAVILPLIVAVVIAVDAGLPIIELINQRITDRLNFSEAALQDFDLAIATWLFAEPSKLWFGSGIGNAHLYAAPYLLPEHARYAEGQVFSAKTLILRYTSEQGLVGLILLFTFLFSRVLAAAWVRALPWLAPLLPLSLALFAMTLGSIHLMTEVWFTAGILVMLTGHAALARQRATSSHQAPSSQALPPKVLLA